jgi:hypothetical protein
MTMASHPITFARLTRGPLPFRHAAAGCALGLALVLVSPGCKSPGKKDPPPTSSGLPEVTLAARPVKQIQAATRDFFLGRGYVERESKHVYEQVFDRPTKSGRSARALRGRLRLYQVQGGAWKLVGRPMGVEAWHSDLESETDVPQGASQIQAFLADIKAQVDAPR